jgi:DNA polymerase III alpha subunit
MAFIKLEDQSGEIELILFPNAFQQTAGLWERDRIVLVRGKINAKDREGNITDDIKVMVDDAREITTQQATGYQATGRKPKTPKSIKVKRVPMVGPGAKAVAETNPAAQRIYVRVSDSKDQVMLQSLKQMLDAFIGSTEVVLVLGEAASRQAIKLPSGLDRESEGLAKIRELVGADNIKIQ